MLAAAVGEPAQQVAGESLDRRRGLDRRLDPVRLEHVGGRRHRRRTEAEQGIRPRRDRGGDLAGHDHHLASVLEREVRRDQRSRPLACLDDHGRGAETGDDPVAGRESPRRGLDARLVLRHDQPLLDDAAGQVAMRRRVVAVDAAAEHGDGDAADVESAAVGLAVDPARHAADDDEPRRRQLAPERSRHGAAVRGARPRADDRDRGAGKQLGRRLTAQPERRRWVGNRPQERRILRPPTPDAANAHALATPTGER